MSAMRGDRELLFLAVYGQATLCANGHTHDAVDLARQRTPVLGNPRGYPRAMGFKNAAFDPGLVVAIAVAGAGD